MHKAIILVFCLLFVQTTAQAQIKKAQKYLSKGEYFAAFIAFEKDAKKPVNIPVIKEQLSKVYMDKNYPGVNIDSAYIYSNSAIKEYKRLNAKDKKKLQKKKISKIAMEKYMHDIIIEAQRRIEKAPSVDTVNHFLTFYGDNALKSEIEKATKLRNKLALDDAQKQNTYAAYLDLWNKYEKSLLQYNPDLHLKAQKGLLETYIAEKDWVLYPVFESKYPDNIYVKDEKAAYALIKINKKRTFENLKDFIAAYPTSLFKKFAVDYLYELTLKEGQLDDYDYFVRIYPDYNDGGKIWEKFQSLYAKINGKEAADIFIKKHPNYPGNKK